jgi:hypothetical protein
MAARKYIPDQPTYLGGNLHISQGMEICYIKQSNTEVIYRFNLGRHASGKIHLFLHWHLFNAFYKDKPILLQNQGFGVHSLDLSDVDGAELRILQQI